MPKKFTKQGLEKLKKELDYLKNVKQKEITQQLKKAAGFGDFSENAAYDQAKEAKAFLRGRILELEKTLVNAQVIEKLTNNDKIGIGSVVTVSYDNSQQTIQLVSQEEADPLNGKISLNSPLGEGLQGKKIGQEAVISPTGQKIVYKIIKIA